MRTCRTSEKGAVKEDDAAPLDQIVPPLVENSTRLPSLCSVRLATAMPDGAYSAQMVSPWSTLLAVILSPPMVIDRL